ncbi:MAG: class I SAM-dependent methyltransferase, partial [Chloroflexi bacterium]|nr:class I SAM-dependent methyltransferase [Chloroflexota bacterium]
MNAFEELFSNLNGGRVLDVATGEGGFIHILQRYLSSFTSIVGIDRSERVIRIARDAYQNPEIQIVQMDAEQLGFGTGAFDTVNVSASLHHLENVTKVLAEMKRVLKSGGKFILTEMHRDGTTEAQFNAVRIHHWAAAVDSSLGTLHDRTFARDEMLDFIDRLNLRNVTIRDFPNTDSDPMDEKVLQSIEGYLDRYIQRAQKATGG